MRFWNIFGLVWTANLWGLWWFDAGDVAVGVAAILATQCFVAADVLEAIRKPDSILKSTRETA